LDVWLSDYPDSNIIRRLLENVTRNRVPCSVVGHVWGTCDLVWPTEMETQDNATSPCSFEDLRHSFDLIVAADTLWNVDSQDNFLSTLNNLLSPTGQVALVAGMHTGRYALRRFFERAGSAGFVIRELRERNTLTSEDREWTVERDGEEDAARRPWIVWMRLQRA
jgi:nicotinamide N-methyltransferase